MEKKTVYSVHVFLKFSSTLKIEKPWRLVYNQYAIQPCYSFEQISVEFPLFLNDNIISYCYGMIGDEEKTLKRSREELTKEEKQLAIMMMPKKKKRLYDKIQHSKKKKATEVRTMIVFTPYVVACT